MFNVEEYIAKDSDAQTIVSAISESKMEMSKATFKQDSSRSALNEEMARYIDNEQYRAAVASLAEKNQCFLSYGDIYVDPDANTLPTEIVTKNQLFIEAAMNLRTLTQKKQTLENDLQQYQSFYAALIKIDSFLDNQDADADLKRAVTKMRVYIMEQKSIQAKSNRINFASLTSALTATDNLLDSSLTPYRINSYLNAADRQKGGIPQQEITDLCLYAFFTGYIGFVFTFIGSLPPALMDMVMVGVIFLAIAAICVTTALTLACQARTGLAKEMYEVGSVARKASATLQVKQAYVEQLRLLNGYQTQYKALPTIDNGIETVKAKIIAMAKSDSKQQQKMTAVLSQVNRMLGQFTAEAAEMLIRSYNPNPATNTMFSTQDLDKDTKELYLAIHDLANAVKINVAAKKAQQEAEKIRKFSGMTAFNIV